MPVKTITIASGKGGTGKTTLSVHLAHLLAQRKHHVVIADADVEEPNTLLFLQPHSVHVKEATKPMPQWNKEACTLCGACAHYCHFNALFVLPNEVLISSALCHSCYACSERCPRGALPMVQERIGAISKGVCEGIVVVEGRLDVGQEMATPLIAQTLKEAKAQAKEFLVCDAPPGTSCSFVQTVRHSDYVVLVTEPTAFGLHDLTLAVEAVRALGKPFGVVVNRAGVGDDQVEQYCQREGIGVIGRFLHDKGVARYCAKGMLVGSEVRHFHSALEALAEQVEAWQ